MKNILLAILISVLTLIRDAQSANAINYQGVARDNQGHPLINQGVNIRLSILDSSAIGQAVYIETHSVATNATGLFNLAIGAGNVVSGIFSTIPWGQGSKWLQIEMDATGGNNYLLLGTTQFLSVPYALHAQTANSLVPINPSFSTFTMISNPSPVNMSFWEAMDYCHSLLESGFDDWKLPTFEEVKKYVELNGLPASTFSTITQTEGNDSHYPITIVLNDPSHNITGYTNVTTSSFPGTDSWPHKIQCVR